MRWFVGWDADRVQAALNVLGGAAFVLGSVLFMVPAGFAPGIALFLLGSVAMFAGSLAVWRERYAAGARRAGAPVGPWGVGAAGFGTGGVSTGSAGTGGADPSVAGATVTAAPVEAGLVGVAVRPADPGALADGGYRVDLGQGAEPAFALASLDATLTSPATPGR